MTVAYEVFGQASWLVSMRDSEVVSDSEHKKDHSGIHGVGFGTSRTCVRRTDRKNRCRFDRDLLVSPWHFLFQ